MEGGADSVASGAHGFEKTPIPYDEGFEHMRDERLGIDFDAPRIAVKFRISIQVLLEFYGEYQSYLDRLVSR